MGVLPINPEVARGVLRYLAAHQGRRTDPDSEEQPGKILHEVRTGEIVDRGLWPRVLYGTIDATPLFVCALAETVGWTGDDALLDVLWSSAESSRGWGVRDGGVEGDGFHALHVVRA